MVTLVSSPNNGEAFLLADVCIAAASGFPPHLLRACASTYCTSRPAPLASASINRHPALYLIGSKSRPPLILLFTLLYPLGPLFTLSFPFLPSHSPFYPPFPFLPSPSPFLPFVPPLPSHSSFQLLISLLRSHSPCYYLIPPFPSHSPFNPHSHFYPLIK